MLHGEVKVNDHRIGAWSARRLEPLTSTDQVSTYECEVHYYSPMNHVVFDVRHKYSDGAEILVTKVLQRARLMRIEIEQGHVF